MRRRRILQWDLGPRRSFDITGFYIAPCGRCQSIRKILAPRRISDGGNQFDLLFADRCTKYLPPKDTIQRQEQGKKGLSLSER